MAHAGRVVATVVVLVVMAAVAPGVTTGGAGDHPPAVDGPAAEARSADGVTLVTECTLITEPGHYRLANDIVDSTANRCINIQASDVYFDGAGHTVDGVGKYLFDDDGVSVSTKAVLAKNGPNTNVTVTNVVATDFGYGLWYGETSDGRITNNTFRSNGIYGLYVGYGADDNLIANNVVRDIRIDDPDLHGAGIVIANYAHGNVIERNDVRSIERFGIEVAASNHTTIANNTVVDTGGHGITASRPGTVIVDNTVSRSAEAGILVRHAPGVTIAGNTVEDSDRGIALAFSPGATVRDNLVRRNARFGIHFHGGETPVGDSASPGSTVAANTVVDNGEVGILLPRHNNDTVVRDNVVSRNGDVGIRLERNAGNRLVNNTVAGHRIGVVLDRAGGTVLERNRLRDHSEWAILTRRHSSPVTVEDVSLDDGTRVSFTGRDVAIAGASTGPGSLPAGTSPLGRFVKLWPEGDHAWVELSLAYDASSVGEATSVDLWVYDGAWRKLPADAVERDAGRLTTNVTGLEGTTFVVVAESAAGTPTVTPAPTERPTVSPSPSPAPTEAPGQPGFGPAVALLGLLGAAGIARWRRG